MKLDDVRKLRQKKFRVELGHFLAEGEHLVLELQKEIDGYRLRNRVRPGITGWAQVKASYGGNIEESWDKLEYDLFYLKNKSFKFDLFIIFKTIKTLILGRGAR